MPDLVLTMPQARQAAQMYEDGKSLREVARHFGRSVNAARNALLTLGVQMRDQRKETAARNRKRAGRKYRQRVPHRIRSRRPYGGSSRASPVGS